MHSMEPTNIPIFNLIMKPLYCLRGAFSRHRTFLWFCTCVLSMLFGFRRDGTIQEDVNNLNLKKKHYHNMLHLYRSDSFDLPCVVSLWRKTVMEICEFYTVNGRCIVVGDSTKKSKEGRKMMGCNYIVLPIPNQKVPPFTEFMQERLWF